MAPWIFKNYGPSERKRLDKYGPKLLIALKYTIGLSNIMFGNGSSFNLASSTESQLYNCKWPPELIKIGCLNHIPNCSTINQEPPVQVQDDLQSGLEFCLQSSLGF